MQWDVQRGAIARPFHFAGALWCATMRHRSAIRFQVIARSLPRESPSRPSRWSDLRSSVSAFVHRLVSVAESKGDYKVRRLGLVKFQGTRSVATALPEVHDLGRLHPCQ